MHTSLLNQVEMALDEYASKLPSESLTFQSIIREDDWAVIAQIARSEGLNGLASLLDKATQTSYAATA